MIQRNEKSGWYKALLVAIMVAGASVAVLKAYELVQALTTLSETGWL